MRSDFQVGNVVAEVGSPSFSRTTDTAFVPHSFAFANKILDIFFSEIYTVHFSGWPLLYQVVIVDLHHDRAGRSQVVSPRSMHRFRDGFCDAFGFDRRT